MITPATRLHTLLVAVMAAVLALGGAPVRADKIDKLFLPGMVIHGHAKYEGDCETCHKSFDKEAQSALCKDCHKEVAQDIAAKRRYHGLMKEQKDCNICHTDHKGRDARIVVLNTVGFDHRETGYALKGGHLDSKVLCKDCHSPLKKYRHVFTTCDGCHTKDDTHKGSLGKECANCHVEKDWKTTHFDHSKTKFKLTGKHMKVKCKDCHPHEKFKNTPRLCNDCHRKDDKHKGLFGPKCADCHNDVSWKEIVFDHGKQTEYPLRGKHMKVKCVDCHKGDLYKDKLKKDCLSCHRKDDDKSHKGKFGGKCESCHDEAGWKDIPFDHDKKTKYPLRGKHIKVKCMDCHKGDLYKDKLKMDCLSCHRKDDDKSHKGKFGGKCEDCHNESDWKRSTFNHDKQTKYRLLGKHMKVKCEDCHKGDLYKDKLKKDCYACHKKDDKHAGQEGQKCETCHREESWKKTDFDHLMSRYPLTGRHLLVECKKCHLTFRYKDAKSECIACHEKQDVHKRAFEAKCERCHNTRDWKGWDFDHSKTDFDLKGKHQDIRCAECHRPNGRTRMDTGCVECHGKDDRHDGSYGPRCEHCHAGEDWKTIKVGSERWIRK